MTIHFEVNAALKRKIEASEAFDAVVLNPGVLDDLIRQGRLVPETRTDIGRAGLGVGVRAGAPRPDIGSAAAFRQALLTPDSAAPGLISWASARSSRRNPYGQSPSGAHRVRQ